MSSLIYEMNLSRLGMKIISNIRIIIGDVSLKLMVGRDSEDGI